MPGKTRYAEYRKSQTTIWVSKPARTFLTREKKVPSEPTSDVVDRLLRELRKYRKSAPAKARRG